MVAPDVLKSNLEGLCRSSPTQPDVIAAFVTAILQNPQPADEEYIEALHDDLPRRLLL